MMFRRVLFHFNCMLWTTNRFLKSLANSAPAGLDMLPWRLGEDPGPPSALADPGCSPLVGEGDVISSSMLSKNAFFPVSTPVCRFRISNSTPRSSSPRMRRSSICPKFRLCVSICSSSCSRRRRMIWLCTLLGSSSWLRIQKWVGSRPKGLVRSGSPSMTPPISV